MVYLLLAGGLMLAILAALLYVAHAQRLRSHVRADAATLEARACTTVQAKVAYLASCTSAAQVRQAWTSWQSLGWSVGGLLHAQTIERILALGGTISPEERRILADLPKVRARGASMPTIHGGTE